MYNDYFENSLPFFKDERYIKVDNKPIFHIYRIEDLPELEIFTKIFNDLANEAGFNGIYFIATVVSNPNIILNNSSFYGQIGMDVFFKMRYGQRRFFEEKTFLGKVENKLQSKFGSSNKVGDKKKPLIFDYKIGVSRFNISFPNDKYISCVFPNWDNSARSVNKSLIFKNATPNAWQKHLQLAVNELLINPLNPQIIIIKSWNEWAEGNHLEPDSKYGREWLHAVKNVKDQLIL